MLLNGGMFYSTNGDNIDGNPLQNIDLIVDPKNFVVIMKDGKIYKNTIN